MAACGPPVPPTDTNQPWQAPSNLFRLALRPHSHPLTTLITHFTARSLRFSSTISQLHPHPHAPCSCSMLASCSMLHPLWPQPHHSHAIFKPLSCPQALSMKPVCSFQRPARHHASSVSRLHTKVVDHHHHGDHPLDGYLALIAPLRP